MTKLTFMQEKMLLQICDAGGVDLTTNPMVTKYKRTQIMLQKLVELGMLEPADGDDTLLVLTDAGRAAIGKDQEG